MSIEIEALQGVFKAISSSPDRDFEGLYLYLDDGHRLAFWYYLHAENNHEALFLFEEGFVAVDLAQQEVHFEVMDRYEQVSGGGGGWPVMDSLRHRGSASRALYRDDYRIATGERLFLEKGDRVFVPVQAEPDRQQMLQEMQARKHQADHWESALEDFVRSKLALGWLPEEIAASCDWSIEAIRALQSKEKE